VSDLPIFFLDGDALTRRGIDTLQPKSHLKADMALYELSGGNTLAPIPLTRFTDLGLWERRDLQRALRANISAITPGVRTMVLAEEFGDWVGANRRIDLLCLDERARLVVVELKREDGSHMELQALRYAAMISALTFEQAVEAHRRYLTDIGSTQDPAQAIRDFLQTEEEQVALDEPVRIVLAAASFNQELTTAVLWLNQQGLDIRCVQMRPHALPERVLLDIQQVIPLPEAVQYQIAIREKEKAKEQAVARTSERNLTRYNLQIGGKSSENIAGRRLIYEVVAEVLRNGLTPLQISQVIPWRGDSVFLSAPGNLDATEFEAAAGQSSSGYFVHDSTLFHIDGKTYALTKRWGDRLIEAVNNVAGLLPDEVQLSYSTTSSANEPVKVTFAGYEIVREANTTINVFQNGQPVVPAKPVLRSLAQALGISELNGVGKPMNTRQLGARVIDAALAQEE